MRLKESKLRNMIKNTVLSEITRSKIRSAQDKLSDLSDEYGVPDDKYNDYYDNKREQYGRLEQASEEKLRTAYAALRTTVVPKLESVKEDINAIIDEYLGDDDDTLYFIAMSVDELLEQIYEEIR